LEKDTETIFEKPETAVLENKSEALIKYELEPIKKYFSSYEEELKVFEKQNAEEEIMEGKEMLNIL